MKAEKLARTEPKTSTNIIREMKVLNALKQDFIIKVSTYTASIEYTNANNIKLKFLSQQLNKRAFIGSQIVKRDLLKYTANEVPQIDEKRLNYFSQNLQESNFKKIINIDLKNAYATVLYNDGFICEDSYNYLLTLPKIDRLAAVGMLAYKKDCFAYSGGKLVNNYIEKGEYSSVFFYAVRKTHEVMNEISKILGKNFLFSWVDGIYFTEVNENILSACQLLESLKYPFKIEYLNNFICEEKKDFYFVTFEKESEKKVFNIPKASKKWQNDLYEFINENKNKYDTINKN
jgi:hypothetical protein